MHVVGSLSQAEVQASLASFESGLESGQSEFGSAGFYSIVGKVYFYDIQTQKQSVIQIGYPALAATDADYYPATVMNYILGGGGFASP